MNLFLRELKVNRRSWLILSVSMALLTIITMWVYPSIASEQSRIDQLISTYPKELLAAFHLDELSLADILGFYATESYPFILLLGGMFAILLAGGIMAKEESEKTIEFLLARPVTRSQIVSGKMMVVLLYILLFNLVQLLVAYLSFEWVKQGPYAVTTLLLLHLGAFLVHLIFASLGLALAVFIPKLKALSPLGIGLVLGTYFFSIMVRLSSKLAFLAYISPFEYADAVDVIKKGGLQPQYLAIALVLVAGLVATTYFFYNRKDITV